MITRHPTPGIATDSEIRCKRCNRLLAERATRPWHIRCSRCGAANDGDLRQPAPEPPQTPNKPAAKPTPKPKTKARRKRRQTHLMDMLS